MNSDEIIEECVYAVRDYIRKNNYHIDYPEENIHVIIDKDVITEEEHSQYIEKLKEHGLTIIYTNVLNDGKNITAIDNINKNVSNIMYEIEKNEECIQYPIGLDNENLKLYNVDKEEQKPIKNTGKLRYWL